MTIISENKKETFLGLLMVAAGVLIRLLPHPENFTPVTAIAFFSGVVLKPRISLWVPLLTMMITDIVIGSHSLLFLTWGCFLAVSILGVLLRSTATPMRLCAGSLAGSVMFFVVTNLGVFFFDRLYPMTVDGFVECFVMAIPFFRNSLLGDLIYTGLFFGVFYLLKRAVSRPVSVQA